MNIPVLVLGFHSHTKHTASTHKPTNGAAQCSLAVTTKVILRAASIFALTAIVVAVSSLRPAPIPTLAADVFSCQECSMSESDST